MTAKQVQVLEFGAEEPGAVVEHMDRLGHTHKGWINLRPLLPPEEEPPAPTGLDMLFSLSVHDVPTCTWVTGKEGRRGVEPDSLGVRRLGGHEGARAPGLLGRGPPTGLAPRTGPPRRGIVVLAPPGTGHAEELAWLLTAGSALSGVKVTGKWQAEVHDAH